MDLSRGEDAVSVSAARDIMPWNCDEAHTPFGRLRFDIWISNVPMSGIMAFAM